MSKTAASVLSVFFCVLTALQGVCCDLYCLQCSDVTNARECNQVKKCGQNELCYSTTVVSSTGRIFRKMGCRDRAQCAGNIVGKRSPLRSIGDLPVCDECCDSNVCQPKLCQDQDYNAVRGPICFNCHARLRNEPCSQIKQCGRDEVCSSSLTIMPSGTKGIRTNCFVKTVCQRVSASSNFHQTNDTCFKCCEADLCNTDCGHQSASPIAATTVAKGLTFTTSTAQCVDITPRATCQVASSIVCVDRLHAQNANCLHYCGFC